MKLYHGSKTHIIGSLEPRVSFELTPQVYATDDYIYALVRSGSFDITKILIREEYQGTDGPFELAEVVPGAFKEVFDHPGYIYEVNPDGFIKTHEFEFVNKNNVKIEKTIKIDSVWDELQNHLDRIKLIHYGDEDYWSTVRGGKKGYIERKTQCIEQILEARK